MKLHGRFTAMIVLILVTCGIGSGWLGFRIRDEFNSRIICVNNLRMLSGAMGSFGMENKLSRGQRVSVQQLSQYFKDGGKWLRCPANGTYDPGLFTGGKDIGGYIYAPTCSVHGSLAAYGSNWNPAQHPNPYFTLSTACFVIASLMALAYFATRRKMRRQRPEN